MTPFPTLATLDFEDTVPSALLNLDTRCHDPREHLQVDRQLHRDPLGVVRSIYPTIAQEVRFLWGTQELQNRFFEWMLENRDGSCQWPRRVHEAILVLSVKHSEETGFEGQAKFADSDFWR